MLFVGEAALALLLGVWIGEYKKALVALTAAYLLKATGAALGLYGALSEWDDVPYWVAGLFMDAVIVVLGVALRRAVERRREGAGP